MYKSESVYIYICILYIFSYLYECGFFLVSEARAGFKIKPFVAASRVDCECSKYCNGDARSASVELYRYTIK